MIKNKLFNLKLAMFFLKNKTLKKMNFYNKNIINQQLKKTFLLKEKFVFLSELSYISFYFFVKNNLDDKFESKFFWYKFLTEKNINTPKVYYFNNKKINEIDCDYFIKKPNIGIHGNGIKKINLKNLELVLSNREEDILIQELLIDNFIDKNTYRSFRIVTLYNKKVLIKYCLNNNCLTSNAHSGGNIYFMDLEVNNLNLSELEISLLNELIEKLLELHNKKLNHIFSIGWDLMFHNNNLYVLEGNTKNPGIILKAKNKYPFRKYVNRYFKEAIIFDKL